MCVRTHIHLKFTFYCFDFQMKQESLRIKTTIFLTGCDSHAAEALVHGVRQPLNPRGVGGCVYVRGGVCMSEMGGGYSFQSTKTGQ